MLAVNIQCREDVESGCAGLPVHVHYNVFNLQMWYLLKQLQQQQQQEE